VGVGVERFLQIGKSARIIDKVELKAANINQFGASKL
jgi:hypothetical protein